MRGAVQPPARGLDVAVLEVDLGAHGLQALQVLVDGPGADGAAAGQGHPGLAEAGQQRPQHQHRGPHGLDQLVGGLVARQIRVSTIGDLRRPGSALLPAILKRTPRLASSRLMVRMSTRGGTLRRWCSPAASRVAASMGRAAFLAPLICTSPLKGAAALMTILSIL